MKGPGERVDFDDLTGLGQEGCEAAFAVFHDLAVAHIEHRSVLRPALPVTSDLYRLFAAARAAGPALARDEARRFFTAHFEPRRISDDAFFTGYYEPVVAGSSVATAEFVAPLLARPSDLKTFAAGEPRPAWAHDLAAARIGADGALSPYPTRDVIEAAVGTDAVRPLVWLRDWTEVFLIHVQGSARVRLEDGRELRLTYAGRNGHPYTSIGRLLVDDKHVEPEAMSLAQLKGWLRANGQEVGQPGRRLMQRNASYIFFAVTPDDAQPGPTGGAGIPLRALHSIAVDRTRWCYGLPFWIDAMLPSHDGSVQPFRRLALAADTGSAIVGEARVDLFVGSGEEAGERAGSIRHHGSLTVLWPRPDPLG